MSRVVRKCLCCRADFTARQADVDRGWAKFCSKSCKAKTQTANGGGKKRQYPRHDGRSPMMFKKCDTCGDAAINGVRGGDRIEWYCSAHEYDPLLHPMSGEALGQW